MSVALGSLGWVPLDDFAGVPSHLFAALTDAAIRRATSGGAYVRGAEYARQNHVTQLTYDAGRMTLSALVRGSGRRTYSTEIQLDTGHVDPIGPIATGPIATGPIATEIVETWCSCPIGYGCKHAAALLVARSRLPTPPEPARVAVATWERHVANLLDGLRKPSPESAAPIALEFEADYCFVLDPWWNPAVEAQAVDRTHRIGQRRTVMVYRLVSTDTIETKVMELKARKQRLFASVLDGDGEFGAALTADDIRGLLGA